MIRRRDVKTRCRSRNRLIASALIAAAVSSEKGLVSGKGTQAEKKNWRERRADGEQRPADPLGDAAFWDRELRYSYTYSFDYGPGPAPSPSKNASPSRDDSGQGSGGKGSGSKADVDDGRGSGHHSDGSGGTGSAGGSGDGQGSGSTGSGSKSDASTSGDDNGRESGDGVDGLSRDDDGKGSGDHGDGSRGTGSASGSSDGQGSSGTGDGQGSSGTGDGQGSSSTGDGSRGTGSASGSSDGQDSSGTGDDSGGTGSASGDNSEEGSNGDPSKSISWSGTGPSADDKDDGFREECNQDEDDYDEVVIDYTYNMVTEKNDMEHVLHEFEGELLYAIGYKMLDHCRDDSRRSLQSITNGDAQSTRIHRNLDWDDRVVCVDSLPRDSVGV